MPKLLLAVGIVLLPLRAAAFESHEHRDIGNCALRIVYSLIHDLPLTAETPRTISRPELLKQLEWLLPRDAYGGVRQCNIPKQTAFLQLVDHDYDGYTKTAEGKLELKLDPLMFVEEKGQYISPTYGQVLALEDYYLYPEKLLRRFVETGKQTWPMHPGELTRNSLTPREWFRATNTNTSHFQAEAVLGFRERHIRALSLARGDRGLDHAEAGEPNLYGALIANAMADHFLFDSFAPGHIMTPRDVMPGDFALGMHDKANTEALDFAVQRSAALLRVWSHLQTNLRQIFDCTDESRLRICATLENVLNRSLPERIVLRGDNFLTVGTLGGFKEKRLREAAQEYLFLLSVDVLSVFDIVQTRASWVCDEDEVNKTQQWCGEELTKAFAFRWLPPECRSFEGQNYLFPPSMDTAFGSYKAIPSVSSRCSSERSAVLDVPATYDIAQGASEDDKASRYRYPRYSPVLGLRLGREYSRDDRYGPATTVAFELAPIFLEADRNVVIGRPTRNVSLFNRLYVIGAVAVRYSNGNGWDGYGLEGRLTIGDAESDFRYSLFARTGTRSGELSSDNSLGLAIEARTGFLGIAIVLGDRFPLFGGATRTGYIGLELSAYSPWSRFR